MKAPKCQRFPSCGKHHYANEACPSSLPADVKVILEQTNKIIENAALTQSPPMTAAERQKRWRKKNAAEHRKRHREYMRKLRAKDE